MMRSIWALRTAADRGRCLVRSARAASAPFDDCGGPNRQPRKNAFVVVGSPDVGDAGLTRLELRDTAQKHTLLLLRDAFYFYEGVTANDALRPELEPDEATGCCYGFTSSASRHWKRNGEP